MRRQLAVLILLLYLGSCKVNHLAEVQPTSLRIESDGQAGSVSAIENLIAPYRDSLEADMQEIIGEATMDMTKKKPECTLGNWFADLLQEETEKRLGKPVDFTIMNYGGMRIPAISKGPIHRGKIFELMPFDNMMVVVYLDYPMLKQFINHMAQDGGWPQSHELRYDIKNGVATHILLNGKAPDINKTYMVSISDYLANGGGDCDFFKEVKREDLGVLIRDATIEHIREDNKAGKKQQSRLEGRIKVVDDP